MENRLANVGGMDTLVTVRSCEITTGTQGQKVYGFTDHSKVFANVERSVDENIDYGNLEAGQTLTVTIYKIAGLTTRWQLVIEGKAYSITNIDPISRYSPLCYLTCQAIDG